MKLSENINAINRKVHLMKSGYTTTGLAEKIGCCQQTVSCAILGKRPNLRINRLIAMELKVSLQEFWPEFYTLPDRPAASEQLGSTPA